MTQISHDTAQLSHSSIASCAVCYIIILDNIKSLEQVYRETEIKQTSHLVSLMEEPEERVKKQVDSVCLCIHGELGVSMKIICNMPWPLAI